VKVTITDVTTGTTVTTDTFSGDTWCNSVSHSYNSPGWKGHQLKLKFSAVLANTLTSVKVTNVQLWQQVTN